VELTYGRGGPVGGLLGGAQTGPRRGCAGEVAAGAPHLIPEEGDVGAGVHRVGMKRAGKTAIAGKWPNLPSLTARLHV
jgi:hypothetical protein